MLAVWVTENMNLGTQCYRVLANTRWEDDSIESFPISCCPATFTMGRILGLTEDFATSANRLGNRDLISPH